jgi:hypothetical protein
VDGYIPHRHDCSRRRRYVAPRRTMRDRGGDLISDARWRISGVDWWVVIGLIVLALVVAGGMVVFFEWLENVGRVGR